jgi:hypothetical protein
MLTIEKNPNTVLICCEGQPLAQYRHDGRSSKPYFDVVNLPPTARRRGGENIALARPHDHVWHFGLFFCQRYVDGLNFWETELLLSKNEPRGRCDPDGDVAVLGAPALRAGGPSASVPIRPPPHRGGGVAFAHALKWVTSSGETWVTERREIAVRPPDGDGYRIDWTLGLTAIGKDRVLNSAPPANNEYSGLSYRCLRCMDKGTLLDSEGRNDVKTMLGQPARWADYSGKLDDCAVWGDPDWAGVAMFDHPRNPNHPVRWFCMNDPFGFLAANPTYGRQWTLPEGREVTLRYGVYVHAGQGDKRLLEKAYGAFAGPA